MGKPNFFVTAAGLHLGILAMSIFGYWFVQNRQQENADEDEPSSEQSPTGNANRERSELNCGVCCKEIEISSLKTLACGHKVHSQCSDQMEKDGLECPTCSRERNSG